MYLFNRIEAGRMLADRLEHLKDEPNFVLAMGSGGVIVGQEIAKRLNCEITLLVVKDIILPGIKGPTIGTLNQAGGFTWNNMFSAGQLEELVSEFYQTIELQKLQKMHDINEALGREGVIDRHAFAGHNVIIVNDGLKNGTSVDAAIDYLKPVGTLKIIAATPFASVSAIDRLHILTDEIHCLDVKINYLDTDHYYEDNYIPDKEEVEAIIMNIDRGTPLTQ